MIHKRQRQTGGGGGSLVGSLVFKGVIVVLWVCSWLVGCVVVPSVCPFQGMSAKCMSVCCIRKMKFRK